MEPSWERFLPTWPNAGRTVLQLVAAVVLALIGWQVYQTLSDVRAYVRFQKTELESESYQKLMRQNVAVGAGAISVFNSINTQTLPEVKRTLQQTQKTMQTLDGEIARLGNVTTQLEQLVRNTDASINGERGTLAHLNTNLASAVRVTESASLTIERLGAETTAAVADLRTRINDPKIPETLANVEASTQNLIETTARTNAVLAEAEASMKNVTAMTGELRDAAGITKDAIKSGSKATRIVNVLRIGILASTLYGLIF